MTLAKAVSHVLEAIILCSEIQFKSYKDTRKSLIIILDLSLQRNIHNNLAVSQPLKQDTSCSVQASGNAMLQERI